MSVLEQFLTWLYGKSGRNAHIREMALKAMEILKENQSLEYMELCRLLGIGFDKYQKPKRTFYSVVNPLKKVKLIQERRVYKGKTRKKHETHYFLTPHLFNGYMLRVIEEFYNKVK